MKRTMVLLSLLAAVAFVSRTPVLAHHSFAATYDETKNMKIEGEITQFQFRNPHSFVQVDAKNDKGVVERWSIEWAGGQALNNTGVNRDTLHPGDHVIVTGKPSRRIEDFRLRLTSMERPKDGWKWSGTFE